MIVWYRNFSTFWTNPASVYRSGTWKVKTSLPIVIESHARVSWWIAIERTKPWHKKVAKLRYQHFIYRWLSDIVILPPFCPDLFLQNPKLGFTSRTQVVIMSISIFGDFRHISWMPNLLLVIESKSHKKVAKMRFQTIIYRTNADIAFLPPFGPGVFLPMSIIWNCISKWQC